ncbi:hypothetical protein D5R81_13695 [Parashewanella spongiae]|uniref:AlgX/AlgJ SGNH hydrolase-like domain-containing protein n=1 Tax=Parashewanella spongiae TaxID=342950 RepID=A0A3A6T8L5_9GAMM|nr:alginate biosynthesis protein AlgX [Parashewanella spongiae]MCL1079022.1 hypothetical protein [Parashewanella spongiae]RJY10955.1 hypothetical protein D5R81_13695 [Parashewanella spongiae]
MKCLIWVLLLTFSLTINAQQSNYTTPECEVINGIDDNNQNKKFIQGLDNWLFTEKQLSVNTEISDDAASMLAELNQQFKKRGSTLILVPVPRRNIVYPHKIPVSANFDFEIAKNKYLDHITTLKQLGLHVADLTSMFSTKQSQLFFKRDFHWRPEGAKVTANLIKEYVKDLPVYQQIKKQQVLTHSNGIYGLESKLQKRFKIHCQDQGYPKEYHKLYQNVSSDSEAENALFEEDEISDVVLLGTSFSAIPRLHFAGFLSEAMQAGVDNYSVAGGGLVVALTQYVHSTEFKNNPPKLIIWEYPATNIKASMFALALPKLEDKSCDLDSVISTNVQLKLGENIVAYNGGEDFKKMKQKQLLFDVNFGNKAVKEFKLTTHFVENRKINRKIGHSRLQEMDGHFLFDPSVITAEQELHFLALAINVTDPEWVGTKVTTKVCSKEL